MVSPLGKSNNTSRQVKGLPEFSSSPSLFEASFPDNSVAFDNGGLNVDDDRLQTVKLPFCISSIVQKLFVDSFQQNVNDVDKRMSVKQLKILKKCRIVPAGIKRTHPFTGVIIFCILQYVRACDLIIGSVQIVQI
jgi:hypothetical protein